MPDPPIPPEATIRVWTCDGCGWCGPRDPGNHHAIAPNGFDFPCFGTVTERVYVDLAAVDREAWVERAEAVLKRTYAHSWRRAARAVVDALLSPEDDRA